MKELCLILVMFFASPAQEPPPARPPRSPLPEANDQGPVLPNGRSQRNAIAKADYKKNLEDAAALVRAAEDLKADLEKEEAFVVSLKAVKKTEEIEKLAKNIRGRLKRY
jgi:hypothetical protein